MPCNFGKCRRDCLIWIFNRTRLEWSLAGLFTLTSIAIIIITSTKTFGGSEPPPICYNSSCLKESARILELVNLQKNPCEDFYQFACSNLLGVVDRDDRLPLEVLQKQQLLQIYQEDIVEDEDHGMVQSAKRLFQACLDEVQIEWDELKTIKKALESAGGWPTLEGLSWNESAFDWLEATYAFRKLGYPYSTFFKISLVADPDYEDKFIFQVSSTAYDYGLLRTKALEEMVNIAKTFGAEDDDQLALDMKISYEFWNKLKANEHPPHLQGSFSKFTVREYRNQTGFDWLDFINSIIGPATRISIEDSVLFPPPQNLTKWISIITSEPKRSLANYMMWEVVESTIHLLHRELRNKTTDGEPNSRTEFCLMQTEQRFDPSPIRLVSDRRYLSEAKREKATELLLNIKQEFIEMVKGLHWLEKGDREGIVKKAQEIAIVIARPEDYDDDTIIDELNADMIKTESSSFLSLITQANRNYETVKYKQIYVPRSKSFFGRDYTNNFEAVYLYDQNILFVPGVVIQRFFQENRPNYLNYGALGTLVGNRFGDLLDAPANNGWSNQSKENLQQNIDCLKKQIYSYANQYRKKLLPFFTLRKNLLNLINFIHMKQIVAERIAYAAYVKWQKKSDGEAALASVDFKLTQLFWIAAATTLCPRDMDLTKAALDNAATEQKVYLCMGNNYNFATDFSCPVGSRMRPSSACQIL